jgi:hypothetical protein
MDKQDYLDLLNYPDNPSWLISLILRISGSDNLKPSRAEAGLGFKNII